MSYPHDNFSNCCIFFFLKICDGLHSSVSFVSFLFICVYLYVHVHMHACNQEGQKKVSGPEARVAGVM